MIRMTPFALIVALVAASSASAQITIRYAPVAPPQGSYAPATQVYSQPWREPATPGSIQVLRPNSELAPPVTAPVTTLQPQLQPAPIAAPAIGPGYAAPTGYAQPIPATNYAPANCVPTTTYATNYAPVTYANSYAPVNRTYFPASQVQQVNYAPTTGYPVRRVANYGDPCGCQPGAAYAPATTAYNPAPYQVAQSNAGVPHYAWQPVLPLRGVPDNYFVGQGILGQPKVYVDGEPIRNFVRYILP